MIFGRDKGMAVPKITNNRLLAFIVAAVTLGLVAVTTVADEFEDIWEEGPGRRPRQTQLDKERLDKLIKHVAQGKDEREKQLHEVYKNDRENFWGQIRDFFHKQRGQGTPREGPPRRGPRNGQGPRRSRWREQLQQRHEEFMGWLKKNYPSVEEELTQLREKDQDAYFRRLRKVSEKYEPIVSAEKRNKPEMATVLKEEIELTDYRDKLLKEFRQAETKRQKKIFDELKVAVSRRFDLIVRKKQLQFEELRRRLERLRRELEKRENELGKLINSKEEATKSRLKSLLHPNEKVDWK